MRLQVERFDWREFGDVVDTTSVGWHREKLPRGMAGKNSGVRGIPITAAEEQKECVI